MMCSFLMRSVLVAPVIVLLCLVCCVPNAEGPEPFTVVWSYDTSGQIEPCGCSAHQLGGLARRATVIDELRAEGPVLAIEGAHILEEETGFQLFKGETIVRILSMMDYDAMMLGAREVQHGRSGIESLAANARFPLFSANLQVNEEPWPTPSAIMEIAGTRVGITGVTQPELVTFELPDGCKFTSPIDALSAALGDLVEDADFRIACLEGDTTWVEETAALLAGEADLFLSGDRSQDARKLAEEAARQAAGQDDVPWELPRLDFQQDPPRINTWGLGRYVGVVDVKPTRRGFVISGENRPIEDVVIGRAEIDDMLDQDYQPQLERFFADFAPDLAQDYIGPEMCGGCHSEPHHVYMATAHSHSLKSLEEAGQLYNPDCMKCHVVYDTEEDVLKPINCIWCHSNINWEHEWQALEGMVTRPAEPITTLTEEWCERCHDPFNSVPFARHWPQYVNMIYHGGDMTAAEQAAAESGLDINEPPPDLTDATQRMMGAPGHTE
jgi:hypothetical protein